MPVVGDTRAFVVGAAIVRAGRVLAARRPGDSAGDGGWEFPGGKVEDGESLETALRREIAEELGCRVEVRAWLAGEAVVPSGAYRLRVARAELTGGEPLPREHDALLWLSRRNLYALDWLPADVPFLSEVAELMGGVR
jgi:8-oxo-dGTP diphosphatase